MAPSHGAAEEGIKFGTDLELCNASAGIKVTVSPIFTFKKGGSKTIIWPEESVLTIFMLKFSALTDNAKKMNKKNI